MWCGVPKLLPVEHNIFPSHRQLAVLFTLADGVLLNRVCLGNIFGHNLAVFTTHNFFNVISVIERPTNSSLLATAKHLTNKYCDSRACSVISQGTILPTFDGTFH